MIVYNHVHSNIHQDKCRQHAQLQLLYALLHIGTLKIGEDVTCLEGSPEKSLLLALGKAVSHNGCCLLHV